MRVPNKLVSVCVRALTQSMNTGVMIRIVSQLIPGYNIHQRTGFPASMPVPNKEAARQIVNDVCKVDLFPDFITLLIRTEEQGIMGKKYPIPYLRQLINGTFALGMIWDPENRMFVEDHRVRKTRNWGTLRLGTEYVLAFLRMDIVGNTRLVRKYPRTAVEQTFADLHRIFTGAVEKRNGRIWDWEGDGGTAAFFFSSKNQSAALSGMEILHELFLYNKIAGRLPEPVSVRLASHSGPFEYSADEEKLKSSETIKRLIDIEHKLTPADSLTISQVIRDMLDSVVSSEFSLIKKASQVKYFNYSFTLERP